MYTQKKNHFSACAFLLKMLLHGRRLHCSVFSANTYRDLIGLRVEHDESDNSRFPLQSCYFRLHMLRHRGRVPSAIRLTRFVVLDVTEVTAAGRRRTRVQVFAAGRRLHGRDWILRRKREQRFRGLGRVPHPAAAVVMMVVMVMMVLVVLMMVMVVTMTMFLATFDVLQLQIYHVLLSATTVVIVGGVVVVVVDDLITVQVLVAKSVTAKCFGGQVVPRFYRFHGAVLASVRRGRLRLDRVLSRRDGRRVSADGRGHRVVVPVQRVRAQRRRVRRLTVLGQAVLGSAVADAGRRTLAYPLV